MFPPVLTQTIGRLVGKASPARRVFAALTVLFLVAIEAGAQSAALEPSALSRVPLADAGDGLYWQQLRITLGQADEASSEAIRIDLPALLELHDGDGDGALFDEVRIVYRAVDAELPRFETSTKTTAKTIVLSSRARAAAGGQVYVQFPSRSAASSSPSATSTVYQAIEFADPLETDLTEQLPNINFVGATELAASGSMGIIDLAAPLAGDTDTLTSTRGTVFPELATILVLDLPDLVFDGGEANRNDRTGLGDGNDANDTPYRFYFATEPDLTQIGPDVATPVLLSGDEMAYEQTEGVGSSVQLLVRDLPADTYWLYVVSDVTGRTPLGRSRAIQVRHQPVVEQLGPLVGGTTAEDAIVFDSGGLLDLSGVANGEGPRRLVIDLTVVDHDDSARAHLFYSADPNLGPSDVSLEGELAQLAGATAITPTAGLPELTQRYDWGTISPLVPEGDYYIYLVATGGSQANIDRSAHPVLVRHSPFLRLDDLDDVLAGEPIVTGAWRPQRFLTLGWGQSGIGGDLDADDEATISLYLSADPDVETPGGAGAIVQSAHLIAADLQEESDDRQSNQFVWDLWGLESGTFVPAADQDYYVYGVIADGNLQRLTRMGDSTTPTAIRFEHPPAVRPLQPSTAITVGAGESARVSWQDMDLDDDARLRIILSAVDHGDTTNYTTIVSGQAYVINSTDGFALARVDENADLSENDDADAFDLTTGHLQRGPNTPGAPQQGTYHVYLAITDSDSFGADTRAWRAPGTLTLGAPATIPQRRVFNLLPENFTIGTEGSVQKVDIVVDALEETADLVLITLRLDANIFDVVDQDLDQEGVQPFLIQPGFEASKLVTNRATETEGSLLMTCEYFDPAPGGIPTLSGDRALVAMEVLAAPGDAIDDDGVSGSSDLQILSDAENDQPSQLERDGQVVVLATAEPLATARLLPGRATVNGIIALEGRVDRTANVDIAWRHWGAFIDIEDSLFAVSNDVDEDRPGVQVSLQPDGSFLLTQTPEGRLDLHVRIDGYLEGHVPGLELHPGAALTDIRPTTTEGDTLLLGGDVAGYLDVDGVSQPDNEVTLADWDFLASLFGRQLEPDDDSVRADITGDGQVDIRDLSLVGNNFRVKGPVPVFRTASVARSPRIIRFSFDERSYAEGDTLVASLQATSWSGIRAFEAVVDFDEKDWRLMAVEGNESTLLAQRLETDHGRWGLTRIGAGDVGIDPLRWRLVARHSAAIAPRLTQLLLLDAAYRDVDFQAGPRTGIEDIAVAPARFGLRPNYPNPFNPATTIEFDIDAEVGEFVQVELGIYDVLGQRLTQLVSRPLHAGHHRVSWNGRDSKGERVSSGVYFAQLRAGSNVQTRPMLLLK